MLITKFAYNNFKNASINHIVLKMNYYYYLCALYKKNLSSYFKLKINNKLITEL